MYQSVELLVSIIVLLQVQHQDHGGAEPPLHHHGQGDALAGGVGHRREAGVLREFTGQLHTQVFAVRHHRRAQAVCGRQQAEVHPPVLFGAKGGGGKRHAGEEARLHEGEHGQAEKHGLPLQVGLLQVL